MTSEAAPPGSPEALLAKFGIAVAPGAVRPFPGGRDLRRVEHGDGLLLKRFWRLDAHRAPILDAVLEVCSSRGITPPWLPSTEGGRLLRSGDAYYGVRAFVPERPDPIDSARAAESVARMHLALADVPYRGPEPLPPLHVPPGQVRRLLHDNGLEKFAPLLDAAERLAPQVPRQLVHNDLHPGNFLAGSGGRVYLIDFESFSANPRIVDVLFAGFRLGEATVDAARRFLDLYAAHLEPTPEEHRLGPLLLAADFVRKIAFILKEREAGNAAFMSDMEKYRGYADAAATWAERSGW